MKKAIRTANQVEIIGRSVPQVGALEKVTGRAQYPGDLRMEGQVYMKVLFARRPHARILGIDPAAALELPGILAVLTARDVPVNLYGIEIPDQPVLCSDVVRFAGDRIALVVAESETLAARAAGLVRVEFADLPVVDCAQAAREPGAPILHPDKPSNLLVAYQVQSGDLAVGFDQADLILEESYSMGSQEHAYLQPDAGLAWVDEQGRVVVHSAGQWVQDDRRQIAQSLDLPEERVRVLYAQIGGAFGGREDLNLQICLALAAWKVGRPVKGDLEPGGDHDRPSETPPDDHPPSLGGYPPGEAGCPRDRDPGRCRSVCLHQRFGSQHYSDDVHRSLQRPERAGECQRILHEQPGQWRIPGVWRAAGSFCSGGAHDSPGCRARHGSG